MVKTQIEKTKEKIAIDQSTGASLDLLEQLYDDHYKKRIRVYKMNFVRGIFFGLGSVIGATIVVSLLIWVLSLMNVPENILDQIDTKQSRTL